MDEADLDPAAGVITELVKLAGPIKGLRNRLELLEAAKRIQDSLPSPIREVIQSDDAYFDIERAAIGFACCPRDYLDRNINDTRQVLSLLEDMFEGQTCNHFELDKEDIEAVGSLMRLLGNVRARSKRQLKQFLSSLECGEDGWLVMRHTNKGGLEARFKYEVTPNIKKWFELEMTSPNGPLPQ